jgi:hypothetical protein
MKNYTQASIVVLLAIIAYCTFSMSLRLDHAESAGRIAMEASTCNDKCGPYVGYDFETRKVPDGSSRDKCIAGCSAIAQKELYQLLK